MGGEFKNCHNRNFLISNGFKAQQSTENGQRD